MQLLGSSPQIFRLAISLKYHAKIPDSGASTNNYSIATSLTLEVSVIQETYQGGVCHCCKDQACQRNFPTPNQKKKLTNGFILSRARTQF